LKRITAVLIVAAILVAVGCDSKLFLSKISSSKQNTADLRLSEHRVDEATLMATSDAWARAAKTGNVDSILSYWSDDAVVMEPDRPAISGKDALRKMVQGSMKDPEFRITWRPERGVISESGDLGYLIEHSRVTFTDPNGKVRKAYRKGLTLWKKDASGKWKCVVDTWNGNPTLRVFFADYVDPSDTTF